MEKVFGLSEARKLAARKHVSVQTVMAVLEILGVPNVVGQQAKAAIDACKAAIKTACDKIAEARKHKETEIVRISEVIADLNRELAAVVATTAGVEGAQNSAVKLNQGQVADLEKIAKRFG
ncbi:MAG: hypothetical protein AAB577_02235 [Patescibacteria group bacterium]